MKWLVLRGALPIFQANSFQIVDGIFQGEVQGSKGRSSTPCFNTGPCEFAQLGELSVSGVEWAGQDSWQSCEALAAGFFLAVLKVVMVTMSMSW